MNLKSTHITFGLKYAGSTYQRLMDRILAPMIERNVQTYVNNMVLTSEENDQYDSQVKLEAEPKFFCVWGGSREVP